MKKCLVLFIILLSVSCILGLPPQLTQKGNPQLYQKLIKPAKRNLKSLPSNCKKGYQALLKQHPDILMAYLLAYESNANLCASTPETILSNYQQISMLLHNKQLSFTPEFFLSYIAKQTVSDEMITPYRQALLQDGLQSVIDSCPDELSLFRATTLWCVSRLQFKQTSGRDQTPLDITQKSLIGRCEEMQILFVAAARTVGLPSRPATAPWWAHMDNNHAWAEVFLDGAWHYTGDMDAAWYPDQTWFSGMIDKTVLILADGSLADQSDEVLSRGTYDTLINSTRNYAKERSRLVKLKVWDFSGKAASKVRVIPMVFNWGSLRALTALDTDEQGLLSFTVGRGAFYLSLFANNQKALCFIPSNSQDTLSMEIHLSVRDFEAQSQLMEFPSNPMQWDTQPESYRKAVEAEKQLWNRKTEDFRQTIPADMDSLALAVAEECRGNYPALQQFLQAQNFVEAEFWEFLLMHDPKFLWQASAVQFQALYANFLMQKPYLSGGEEDLSLLSPTIYYEDLPLPFYDKNAKPRLYPEHFMVSGTAPRDRVKLVMHKLAKKHKVNNKKALSGLLTLNIAQAEKHLSSVQYRILACNMLRANGIPAEFSRIPDLITIFVDGDWEYYNVSKQIWENRSETSQETMHLWVQIEDESGIPIQAGEEQLTLCRYVDGMFYPLNHRFEYKGKGMHQGSYSRQDCYLQFGYRISESQTGFHLQPIKAEMADSTTVRFVAKNYPRTWNPATEDILAMVGADILNANTAIIIGNYDQENSKRLADKLLESNTEFLWLGYQNSATAPENYLVHPVWVNWVAEDSHNVMRSITLIKNSGEWQMYEGLWEKLP